jgi:hypothetical protein
MFMRFYFFLCLLALCFITYVFGIASAKYEFTVAKQLSNSMDAIDAYIEKNEGTADYFDKKISLESTIKSNKPEINSGQSWGEYTLLTFVYHSSAYLIDLSGNVVHKWNLPFSNAWKNPPHIRSKVPDKKIYFDKVHAFPNGDLIVLYMGFGDTPYGYGLVKIDKDSNIIWKYAANAHHDFYVANNGNIHVITQEWVKKPQKGLENLHYPVLNDYLVTLSPDGNEIEKISVLEAFANSGFKEYLYNEPTNLKEWDWLHTNSVAKLEAEQSTAFPMFKAGQLLISLRNLNAIAVIDPQTAKVVWMYRGVLKGQHSAHFTQNGTILAFDNRGYFAKNREYSRILELSPATLEILWSYTDVNEPGFYSYNRSRVQRLANGNTLITESIGRRAFEINHSGEIVWSYRLPIIYKNISPEMPPFKKPSKQQLQNRNYLVELNMQHNLASVIQSATRYSKEQVAFINISAQ